MRNKGITLIALVITVIVLLILAGISISMLSGNNSVLKNATKAKKYSIIGRIQDETEIIRGEYVVENKGKTPTPRYIIEKLIEQREISEIQVEDYGDDTGKGIIIVEGEKIEIVGFHKDVETGQILFDSRNYSFSYNYEIGMTWREFLNSKYNDGSLKVVELKIGKNSKKNYIVNELSQESFNILIIEGVENLDEIIEENNYFVEEEISLIDNTSSDKLSGLNGITWETILNDPKYSAFKDEWGLECDDSNRISVNLGYCKKYICIQGTGRPIVKSNELFSSEKSYIVRLIN